MHPERPVVTAIAAILTVACCDAFTAFHRQASAVGVRKAATFISSKSSVLKSNKSVSHHRSFGSSLQMIFAPPGSGYCDEDDEESVFPETYEPMMEYPGTMRPGRTPENMPFHDLPIADDDPDPVPWPHFQQIEWHHKWEPPHPHPIPVEDFIELQGRWATPEMEAAMRAGARRDVKERREAAEAEKKSSVIMDDDDDEVSDVDIPIDLGEGVFGQLGSTAEEAITAAAVAPPSADEKAKTVITDDEQDDEDESAEGEDDFDDFLLDLGLDADVGDDDSSSSAGSGNASDEDSPAYSTKGAGADGLMDALKSVMEMDEDDDDASGTSDDDDDDDEDEVDDDVDLNLALGLFDDEDEDDDAPLALDTDDNSGSEAVDEGDSITFDDDDDDDVEGEDYESDSAVDMVPLDDFDEDDNSDTLTGEDAFDDGDIVGGDVW
mmetsp:Transcript_28355/g.43473  ORF Transcript_28355/g.43473 Transcript_28355/m.43473 type:complete len:436 (+) Transcript_28355:190-1497(+)